MIEHLVILLLESMHRKEQERQQAGLASVVPEVEQLYADPAATLARQDVTVPPMRYTLVPLVGGVVLGLAVSAVLAAVLLGVKPRALRPRQGPPAVRVAKVAGLVALVAIPPALAVSLLRRVKTGGELVLTRAGAEFRHRGRAVVCPWVVFKTPAEFRGDVKSVVLPINPRAADRVELLWHGGIIDCGPAVRTKAFRFVADDEVELRNVYAANLRDVARLLQHLGRTLG